MRLVRRDEIFDIGLAREHRAVFGLDIFPTSEEMTCLGDRQRADAIRQRKRKHGGSAGEHDKSCGEAAYRLEQPPNGALHRFVSMSRTFEDTDYGPQAWRSNGRGVLRTGSRALCAVRANLAALLLPGKKRKNVGHGRSLHLRSSVFRRDVRDFRRTTSWIAMVGIRSRHADLWSARLLSFA